MPHRAAQLRNSQEAFLDAIDSGYHTLAPAGAVDLDAEGAEAIDTFAEDDALGEDATEPDEAPGPLAEPTRGDDPDDDSDDPDDDSDDSDDPDDDPDDHSDDDYCDDATEVDTVAIPADADESPPAPPRFSKPVAIGFGVAVAVVAVILATVMISMRPTPTVVADPEDRPTPVVVVQTGAQQTLAPAPAADSAIPYTASADCPIGSTPAQSLASPDPTQAWVCVRNGVNGQVLTIDLGRPMMVTGLAITPGWVGPDSSGTDQWLHHRVVTLVDWILLIGDQVSATIPQDTKNAHGETIQPVTGDSPGRGVLASRIVMLVKETSRPPAQPDGPASPDGTSGGLLSEVLGGAPGQSAIPDLRLSGQPDGAPADPVDGTFAVSSIRVLGHTP